MITRIEIDGFKTFRNFSLNLAPLQVIVGPNGAGKSNLFDVLRLLSRLVESDLRTAFQDLRGEAGELFTILPSGERVNRMRLAVELLVEPNVRDSWGAEAAIRYTRLRYELVVLRDTDQQGLDRLYVDHEALLLIRRSEDQWIKQYGVIGQEYWLPKVTGGRAPFISTESEHGIPTVYLHQDDRNRKGSGGRKGSVAARMERTVLSGIQNTESPHAFAASEEMRNWHFLQLNPESLRKPSPMVGPQTMAVDGKYLPGTLARLQAEDQFLLTDLSRDLANLVPGIVKIHLETDKARDEYVIWAEMEDGRRFSSRVLSDGTLRMLALIALKNDPDHKGVLCFEEPENGVHPFRLKKIAHLLTELGTDFADSDQQELPLRQFLSNTHSPLFIKQPDILPHLLFAHTVLRSDPMRPAQQERVTQIVPIYSVGTQMPLRLGISTEEAAYTLGEVQKFLEQTDLGETRTLLESITIPTTTQLNGQ